MLYFEKSPAKFQIMAFFRRSKNTNKPVFGQVLSFIPSHLLTHLVKKYQTDKGCSKYKTYYQLVALIFGQLNKCYTLTDISCGLSISSTFLNDVGLQQSPAKSTMSDGNKKGIIKSLSHFITSC